MKLNINSRSMVPAVFIDAKMSNLTRNRLDIIYMVLAEIGKDTDDDENLDYIITAENFAEVKGYKLKGKLNRDKAYKVLKHDIFGEKGAKGILDASYEIHTDKGWGKKTVLFQDIEYTDGAAKITLQLSQNFKKILVDVKKQKGARIFAALRYTLPMESVYSKRLYLMCKEFEFRGKRFTEKSDFSLFRERIGIPDSYRNKNVEKLLKKCVEEINAISDINVSYELFFKSSKGRGGKTISGISFDIKTKKEAKEHTVEPFSQNDDSKCIEKKNNAKMELMEKIRGLFPEMTGNELGLIVSKAEKKKLTDEELWEIVEYVKGVDARNVVGYIISLISNGMNDAISNCKNNEFLQNQYNFAELEKQLLEN